ncbi:P-type ATPase [Cylindrobasidium torrendii FP15055 ss-10]|uniref:Cation-transporting ATPase n=1 Tax=Cylindrobasidium torrendii FP15055 ss-10 TaxID=1314674 RepID=A0A0D7B9Q1_9AGAR|nr:P-type ATPase [Cylindrobasidium torrendii FP15055 ss-10]
MSPIAGPSNGGPSHDYTEGASAIDISSAANDMQRSRRNSQYSMYGNDGDGAIFSGPGHSDFVNPSSVSRMSHIEAGRRSSEGWSRSRRKSMDSRMSRPKSRRDSTTSQDSYRTTDTRDDGESVAASSRGRSHRPRVGSPPKHTMFESITNLFNRASSPAHARRPSLSSTRSHRRRSTDGSEYAVDTDDEGDDRWGYSSGEEDEEEDAASVRTADTFPDDISVSASMRYGSEPPSPSTQVLPLMSADQIFGRESRIDMDVPFALLDPPPSGPPSRQTVYIEDEDNTIRLIGHHVVFVRSVLWRLGCVLSFGILALLGHWFPSLWLKWVAREKAFSEAEFVVVESAYRDMSIFPIKSVEYPYAVDTAFALEPSAPLLKSPETIDSDMQKLRHVDYRYSRFALDPRTGLFSMVREWTDPSRGSVGQVRSGLDVALRKQRLTLFGPNAIDIEGKSTVSLLVDEVIHPFYVFQIASVILWSLDDYYYYAFCIAVISIFSIMTTLIDTKKTIARMREMSKFSCNVDVLINGTWLQCDSTELVPGDVVNLSTTESALVPCDMFLLSGDAIINESMLTGESVPVTKTPLKDEDLTNWRESKKDNPKSFMYGGTRIIRIRGAVATEGEGLPAMGLITRTGFNTTKGALVRSMLYPKPIGFKFYRDSVRFIGVLALIALIGFSFSAVQFVRIGLPWATIVIRALDLITVVVPPALPATLSIGTSFALSRLRKFGIFCISPSRVNVAGKVNVCCFDKTGTLTEDGLDILGVRGLDRGGQRFGELLDDITDMPLAKDRANFLHAMATCHSLKMVDGAPIGDPLDMKMFTFTKWTLEEGAIAGTGVIKSKSGNEQTSLVQTVVRPPGSAAFRVEDALKGGAKRAHFLELGVIRTFEFVSSLRRMSVVVKRLKSSSMEIYVKGAPEVMGEICDKDSFPQDYGDLLSYYTKNGYRVIAIAGKSIEGLSWLKAQRMKREQAESGLRFLGLIIFENKIKPGTAPAIHGLRSAHLACRMITGDNPLTAASVARECGLINAAAQVFSPVFAHGGTDIRDSSLQWPCLDDPAWCLDPYSLKPLTPPSHHGMEAEELDYQDNAIVITGDVFRWMINHAALETLQRMLVKTQIFARMSPDEKNEVVERLQSLGYTVLMCGDGANDCAALKAADVGISLSEAEASVAAPFTSSTPDIGCVLEVIKEGRAALVTSFSCFKYMALYSMIQFTTVTLLYWFASSLGDFQFLYIDLFIIIPVAVTMGRTHPFPRVHPKRPTASLVSKKVLSSIIGQILITSVVQLWVYIWVRKQEWYTPPPTSGPENGGHQLESTNFENSVLFLVSCFQYILVAAVFSIGPPYRKPIYTNSLLMLALGALTAFNLVVLIAPPETMLDLLTLMPLPIQGRTFLAFVVVVNLALSVVYEKYGAEIVGGLVGTALELHSGRRRVRDGKMYKAVDED